MQDKQTHLILCRKHCRVNLTNIPYLLHCQVTWWRDDNLWMKGRPCQGRDANILTDHSCFYKEGLTTDLKHTQLFLLFFVYLACTITKLQILLMSYIFTYMWFQQIYLPFSLQNPFQTGFKYVYCKYTYNSIILFASVTELFNIIYKMLSLK